MERKLVLGEINKLVNAIQILVTKYNQDGKLIYESRIEKKYTIEGYSYDFNGPKYKSIATENQVISSCRVRTNELIDEIKLSEEYVRTLETLIKIRPEKTNTVSIERFSENIYNSILDISSNSIGECVGYFLNDFFKEDIEFVVEVYLQGIVISSDTLELGKGISLRQVNKADFENKIFKHTSSIEMMSHITACLVFSGMLKPNDINNEIRKYLDFQILKLSLVANGAIRKVMEFPKFYSIEYGWMGVGSLIDKNWYGFEKFVLKEENEYEFKNKFNTIEPPLKLIGIEGTATDELTIAYNHYVESYLSKANIDKRIAQNIMGLEALFSNENNSDLKFKLSNRIARLSWYFGYSDPVLLRDFIKIAYDIRSRFAHGGHYTKKEYVKIEKKFWDEKEFLNRLHEIVAKSILLFSSEEISKNALIIEIDNSFIDNNFLASIENKIRHLQIYS